MHPFSGPSDGRLPASPLSELSPTARRRPRVDSHSQLPSLAPPEAKRFRFDDSRDDLAMSAKVQGKRPEVVDLTAPATTGFHKMATATSTASSAFQPHTGAKKLVIKNLRVAARPQQDIEQYYGRVWAEIKEAVLAILASRPPQQPYERLYRCVEEACLHGQAQELYAMLKTQCEMHLSQTVLPQVRIDAQGASNVSVLRVVLRQWQIWCEKSTLLWTTFSYLDRTYLLNERNLPQINDMLIHRFRRMAFDTKASSSPPPGAQVIAGMCDLVAQDRRGDNDFDGPLLRQAVAMVHVFGVYGRLFEPAFLATSEMYLREFAGERDAAGNLEQYILAVETLLRRETERCHTYNLDTSTLKALLATAQRVLIADKAPELLDGDSVARLLDSGDVGAAKALYELLRLPGLQKKLRKPWEAYIEEAGTAIVTDVARGGDDMVVRLLQLRRRLDLLVRDAFARDEDFAHGLRDAFGRFVNGRRVAAAWPAGASKVGEMVAKHVDLLLRGGLKTMPKTLLSDAKDRAVAERSGQASTADEDAELDRQLNLALELFRFIQGKDVFEAFYKKDLARRLLMDRSASQDAERNMLAKLKNECGSSLTHNLEQMFRDQELSRDEMAAYRQWRSGNGRLAPSSVDLHVSVLSSAAWPTYNDVALRLPPDVLAQVQLFDGYYKTKHTGRQLTWMHALGHCVVRARFDRGTKELHVSAFQAAVLLLFNGDNPLTYDQIAEATGLEGAELDRTLQSLACAKVRVLTKSPRGRDVHKTDTFVINRTFTDPKFRIKINQIQLKETREENVATYERVTADRQFETQAAIVRIMKSRKSLGHAQLVAEVISQTKSRGALDPADIKQNIEKLIEKDYLDREGGNYVYLA